LTEFYLLHCMATKTQDTSCLLWWQLLSGVLFYSL